MHRYKQAAGWFAFLLVVEGPLWHQALVNTASPGPWDALATAVVVVAVTTVGATSMWFGLSRAARRAKPETHLLLAVAWSLVVTQALLALAFTRWPEQIGVNLATEVIGALLGGVVIAAVFALIMRQHEYQRDRAQWLDVETMVVTAIERSLRRTSMALRVFSGEAMSYGEAAAQPLSEQVDAAFVRVRDQFMQLDETAAENSVSVAVDSVDIWPHLVLGPIAGLRHDPRLFTLALRLYDDAQQLRQYTDLRGHAPLYERQLARDGLLSLLLTAQSLSRALASDLAEHQVTAAAPQT